MFAQQIFPELLHVQGEVGGRQLVTKYPDQTYRETFKGWPVVRRLLPAIRYEVDRGQREVRATLAGVFASGTLLWIPKLDPNCAMPCPGRVVTRATENLLAAFGAGPAGQAHPSTANWQTTPTG